MSNFFLRPDAPHPSEFETRLMTVAFTWDSQLARVCTEAAKAARLPLNAWLSAAIDDVTAKGDLTDLLLADLDIKDRAAHSSKSERYGTKIPEKLYNHVGSMCDFLAKGKYPRPKIGVLLRAAALIRAEKDGLIERVK